ncbi:hypothetical protein SAMN05216228_102482 [Rhizobium tibeticum]|uniref:Uncharacterized protein n=2 Tax=Rhizobium tibeticum TaxID=501024 RepID=A0A1H8SDT1_9HYPH|nr:hypothetical protein RTCCBAU85039_4819 [Rhizobium tibeticum]SEO77219.1 hypothetical protein SAMN05216228_102482 [Rhizobium tibeticum]
MKSPWKLITGLVSRRQTPDTDENSAEPAAEAKELEAPQTPADPPPSSLAESSELDSHSHDKSTTAVEPTPQGSDDGTQLSDAESAPAKRRSRGEPARHFDTPDAETKLTAAAIASAQEPRLKLSRKVRTINKLRVKSSSETDRAVQTPPLEDPFIGEVTGLDEDIKQLRNQLAQKLKLQNDQLKKMLERFDVS